MENSTSELTPPSSSNKPDQGWLLLAALLLGLIGLCYVFSDGLSKMLEMWEQDEYSHGYMIPMVALFIVWQRLNELPEVSRHGAWLGLAAVAAGLFIALLGELSAIYAILQYGFLVTFCGLVLSLLGWRGVQKIWPALAYLLFMIPLPVFLYNSLSSELQLISSSLGVVVIRLFDISVYLEGNVIDLGAMKLQVVEACSGLRYLFPLMSFGFLIAYLYRGPVWQKVILFLSTIPITVLMNSFRIGVIGVTVEYWGQEMAEGFLHDFEGWFVFMACVAILFAEMWIFHLFAKEKRAFWDRLNLDTPSLNVSISDFGFSWRSRLPYLASILVLAVALPYFASLEHREEKALPRASFSQFPLYHNGWSGQTQGMEDNILDNLKLTDYIMANYAQGHGQLPVNMWIAYYDSQKKGSAIHSPRACIPGGGWKIDSLTQKNVEGVDHSSGQPLQVNRLLIKKDDAVQVVYYWFEGRNRNITDEYVAKWFIFWDSMTQSRSDDALVRFTTAIPDIGLIDEADQRLETFVKDFYPLLGAYIPTK
jgi:exosortase D (VPLPA-CTERM-specific)